MTTPNDVSASAIAVTRVAISGATGFLGTALVKSLRDARVTVHRLRRGSSATAPDVAWDPGRGTIDVAALEGVDVVVNLAGEPLAQRWSPERKDRIRASRLTATTLLVRTIASLRKPPRVFVSGSAVGYYGNRGDQELDEGSSAGSDFLATVAEDWEHAAEPVCRSGVRLVLVRTGLVLGAEGGALAKMLLPFRLGLGGRIGRGTQWMSWIALADWVHAVRFLFSAETVSGPVNLVAPNPVQNMVFADTLARVLARRAILPLPEVAIDLLFGEMGRATLLASQRVRPRRLLESGFEFEVTVLRDALTRAASGRREEGGREAREK